MMSGADTTLSSLEARNRGYNRIRRAPGFALVAALSAMTISVGVAYVLVPIWASPDAWEQARGPFQMVFTAMLALAGPAIGLFMAGARRRVPASDRKNRYATDVR